MRLPLFILFLFAAVIAIMFAVPNREPVTLHFWPFDFQIELGLYLVAFAGLFLGLLLGWIGSWFAQRKWRKLARDRARRIEHLETEIIAMTDAAKMGTTKPDAARGNVATGANSEDGKIPAITLRR
jgi:uncharacterized integral membrane protein